jgi:hypothetical protein
MSPASKLECPNKKCKWKTPNGGNHKLEEDCGNHGDKFCPQSNFPWFRDGKFRKYPAEFGDRKHCVKVWERDAKKYGYDSEKGDSEAEGEIEEEDD